MPAFAASLLSAAALTVGGPPPENPCTSAFAPGLRCPDLVMRRPHGLYAQSLGGRTLLRAGNSIDNIGRGAAELHGTRIGPGAMRVRQRIYTRRGDRLGVDSDGRLTFKLAHLGLRYWKWFRAAEFRLWRVNADGSRTRRVRRGPKLAYCLRDLQHTRPRIPRSPPTAFYPACSTDQTRDRVTIGTSPGWSDVYPPTYPEQWIDVTGLRGCFAYEQVADPGRALFESSERNNSAQVIVRLPFVAGAARRGCPGPDRGRPFP